MTAQITTERLVIRTPQMADVKVYNEAIQESFDELHQWMPWAQTRESLEESEEFVRQASADWDSGKELGFWIYDKTTDEYLGAIWLHEIDWSVPKFEVGYWLRSSKAGEGFMTEAVNALTQYAFETLKSKRIEIRTDPENVKSRKVAERCGYELETVLKMNELRPDGTVRDTCVYSCLQPKGSYESI